MINTRNFKNKNDQIQIRWNDQKLDKEENKGEDFIIHK